MMVRADATERPAGPPAPGVAGRRWTTTAARAGPVLVLAALLAVFVAAFVRLTWRSHARFGTFGFDLGIFDQGVWLLSRF
jgi:cytochrome b561